MADLVKVDVFVPTATYALQAAGRTVIKDVLKALENGWQSWDDASAIVSSVTKNLVPVAGNVAKVSGEFAAHPAEMATLAGLLLGDLVGLAMKKLTVKKGV